MKGQGEHLPHGPPHINCDNSQHVPPLREPHGTGCGTECLDQREEPSLSPSQFLQVFSSRKPKQCVLVTPAAIRATRPTRHAAASPANGSPPCAEDEKGQCPEYCGSHDDDVPGTHVRYPTQRAFRCFGRRKRCPSQERACRQWRIPSISIQAQPSG